ncbi:MBL fold metallo-hydrolase [Nocardioides bizhenqiangii]|uniref:MBL fold metallo-hydrolase n=1 Tax=Nocardioides bizhenqiangii TaxID=3095076 RepID=A0ABZ0ZU08_9ACTN|nr:MULTISPECIES: MBL fold metallo-hydrolase [unclassified Nocardioides]MDZ5623399.1 MBL fold metallo-hydrolase [Nocardioides sp. HM23]WQQ27723.1 MBL fold metallo-hydrolase [Nocardioides sp. HM61]
MIGQMGTTAFRMTVVGCSGSYPGPDSPASCYLVQAEVGDRTWSVVVDLGNGALGALQRYVDPLEVDAVLLSHLHADHCVDMTSYYVLRKYHPVGTQPKIPVWGPSGTALRLANAYDLPTSPGMSEEFEFHTYDAPFTVGPFEIEAFAVDHPVEAYGMRISATTEEAGRRTLAYSGDTGPTPSLLEIAADADLFLCEASFRDGDDNPPGLHLTGAECGETAAKCKVKRLVLTHVPPWHDAQGMLAESLAVYDGPTELAAAGAVYAV